MVSGGITSPQMALSRRALLKAAGVGGAAGFGNGLLPGWAGLVRAAYAATPAGITTLTRTIVRGALLSSGSARSYYRLAEGPGEPHIVRTELAPSPSERRHFGDGRRSVLSFAHMGNARIVDAQSPARVEFLYRYDQGAAAGAFRSVYRPQEVASAHALEASIRQLRAVRVSPVSGRPIGFAVFTGDAVDNAQLNELRWFTATVGGRLPVGTDSGSPGYEGVMSATWGDPTYWHPEPVADDYKSFYGFPSYPSFLRNASARFTSTGIGLPWYVTVGSHDALMQGAIPRNPVFERVALGRKKLRGLPPDVNPADGFDPLAMYARTLVGEREPANPAGFLGAPLQDVSPDAGRRILTRADYLREVLASGGRPGGHGFATAAPDADGTLASYWHSDAWAHFRLIGLDTVNPGGYGSGSIGQKQLDWLEQRLIEVSSSYYDRNGALVTTRNANRYVILFSSHGVRSLANVSGASTDPLQPELDDQPRYLADPVEALVHRFPNVIAWVSGHDQTNSIVPRPDPTGRTSGFWDIGTGSQLDWPCQSRLLDVVDNSNGTLSIFCTMVDSAAPVKPGRHDPVMRVASIARELAANHPRFGYDSGVAGEHPDRNAELVIRAPFRLPRPSSAPEQTGAPRRSPV